MGVKSGVVKHQHMRPYCAVAISGAADDYQTLLLGFEVGDEYPQSSGLQLWRLSGLSRTNEKPRVVNMAQMTEFDNFAKQTSISNAVGKSGLSVSPSGKIGATGHFSGWIVIWSFLWNDKANKFAIQALRQWCHESPIHRVQLFDFNVKDSGLAEKLRLFTVEPLVDIVNEYEIELHDIKIQSARRRSTQSAAAIRSLLGLQTSAVNVALLRSFSGHTQGVNMTLSNFAKGTNANEFHIVFGTSVFFHPLSLSLALLCGWMCVCMCVCVLQFEDTPSDPSSLSI